MNVLRTPDDRFEDLSDYPFKAHYADVQDGPDGVRLRAHYVDEGPSDAPVVLLMHGEPTWSYLYRHMIPVLADAGFRVIAPDLIGFGRSDKPAAAEDYTYARMVAWMRSLLFDTLDLRDATFFGQDWGGLIGLRLVAAEPERFARVAIANTGLPTGEGAPSEAFLAWQQFSQTAPVFPIGAIVDGGCARSLSREEQAAYDAPFPDDEFKAGARILPSLVPTSPADPESQPNKRAWERLSSFDRPFLLCFSDSDPITKGGDAPFLAKVSGVKGVEPITIAGAAHFLQEDRGGELARVLVEFINAHPS